MQTLAKLSAFFGKTFALWVVVFGILGFIFPDVFKLFAPYVSILLGIVMFGMGLTLTTADFREIFRRPRDVAIGVAAQFTIMPLSAYALCVLMDLPPDVAVGLLLLGCCPGGTASNVVTFLAKGDVPLSVTVTSCTTLMAPVMTPALMYLFGSEWMSIDPTAMFLSIVQIILLPIAAGILSRLGSDTLLFRAMLLEEAGKDYVRTARAKGLSEMRVLFRHVLRNALLPISTATIALIPMLFMGSLVMESFFGIPGLGSYTIDALNAQDFSVVRVMVFLGTAAYIIGLVATDMVYAWADPRIRFE